MTTHTSRRRVGAVLTTGAMVASLGVLSLVGAASASAATADITVCDTGCDYTTIQGAVTAAAAGDTISVAAGTYVEYVTIPSTKDGLTLQGAQAGVDARSRSGAETVVSQGRIVIQADNVTIDGFTVDSSRTTAGGTTAASGIFGQNIEGTQIVNNVVSNNFMGVQIDNSGGTTPALIQYNSFVDNTIAGQPNSGTGAFLHGNDAPNFTIADNDFTGHQNAAINAKIRDSLITNNTSSDDSTFLVLINSSSVEVSNNVATGMAGSGLYFGLGVSNLTIENNVIHSGAAQGSGKAAIRLVTASGSGTTQGFEVTGNSLSGGWDYSVHIASGAYSGEFEAHENSFSAVIENLAGTATVNATHNYWGSVDLSTMTGIEYTPWYLNEARTTLNTDGSLPGPDGSAEATPEKPAVVIPEGTTDPITVTIADGVENATIDFSALLDEDGSATLPETTIVTSTGVSVEIPAGTVVTADGDWDGVILAPIVIAADDLDLPSDVSVSSAIKVGAENVGLLFDRAVRLVLPGQAGTQAGFITGDGELTEITTTCAADTQEAGDAVESDCSISVGDDLVIWTKHFTVFAAYETAAPITPTDPTKPQLANTGSDIAPLSIAAIALLVLGAGFGAIAYRRRSVASRS